jgi:hypothetical protein
MNKGERTKPYGTEMAARTRPFLTVILGVGIDVDTDLR